MPTIKLSKKTTYKKKTTKQKQKQKQIQNVTVNVHQAKPVTRRRSNNSSKQPPPKPPSTNVSLNMPSHHTFYVESGRQQRQALQAPNNAIQPLEAPNNAIEELQAPEEKEKKKLGRPLGSKNREKIYAEPVEAVEVKPVKHLDAFQLDLMNTLKKRKERLENNSDESPHQGLNVSSSSLMNQPYSPEPNLENLVSSVNSPERNLENLVSSMNTPENSIQQEAMSGGKAVTEYDNLKVKELKELCKERNLSIYGSKSDLIEKLLFDDVGEKKTRPYNKKKG